MFVWVTFFPALASVLCTCISMYIHRVDSASVTSRELIRLQNVPVKVYENTLVIIKLESFAKVSLVHLT